MGRVVIVGGGFSGCAASLAAKKAGVDVILLERTDRLVGAGIRAGQVSANGEYTAIEEAKFMGGGEIFQLFESIVLHKAGMIGEKHRYIYNVALVEPAMRRLLKQFQINIRFKSRVIDVEKKSPQQVSAVILENREKIPGDTFIDCTGDAGGLPLCRKYGGKCVMCTYYLCPAYGDRVSIATKAGARELRRSRPDGTPGRLGASVQFFKETLASKLRSQLEKKGALTIPLPKDFINYDALKIMGGPRTREQVENINLVDIGPVAKWSAWPRIPIDQMRQLHGFENVVIEGPPGATDGSHHVNGLSITPRGNSLLSEGLENVFVAGAKALNSGVVPSVLTGYLAGRNAARLALGKECLVLPTTTAIGDFIVYCGESMGTSEEINKSHSMVTHEYWKRMQTTGLYTTNKTEIKQRIEDAGLTGIYAQKTT